MKERKPVYLVSQTVLYDLSPILYFLSPVACTTH